MATPPFRLLAITPPEGEVAADVVERWADLGVGVGLLLRDVERPEAALDPAGRLAALANAARRRGHAVLWSAPAPAVLARPWPIEGIDGVQLRGDPSPDERATVRHHIGTAILGRSVHGLPSPTQAPADTNVNVNVNLNVNVNVNLNPPTYAVFAPVFTPRTTTPNRPPKKAAGLPTLQAWTSTTPHVFALGGITPANAPACIRAGAFGLAGIHAFFAPEASDQLPALAAALT